MTHTAVCAVDVGSSYIKAAVYSADHRLLGTSSTVFPARLVEGRAEADPHAVWDSFTAAVRAAVAAAAVSPTGLAIACQMAGLVMLDNGREPIGPVILGIDGRGTSTTRLGDGQGSAVHSAAKFSWLAENRPADVAAAAFVGGVKEYLLAQLTGAWVTDPSSASVSGLYSIGERAWSSTAVADAALSVDALPDVLRCTSIAGRLLPAAAAACSMPSTTEVAAGIGDGPAGSLAAGAIGPGRVCVSLGTTLVARLFLRCGVEPDLPDCRVPLFVQHVDGDWFCVGARLDQLDGRDDSVGSIDAPGLRLRPSDLPEALAPLFDRFSATELRPVGNGLDVAALVALAEHWSLPVVQTAATDGTLGAAGLLTRHDAPWPEGAPAADVLATFTPEGRQVTRT